jgi:hypothetical protein
MRLKAHAVGPRGRRLAAPSAGRCATMASPAEATSMGSRVPSCRPLGVTGNFPLPDSGTLSPAHERPKDRRLRRSARPSRRVRLGSNSSSLRRWRPSAEALGAAHSIQPHPAGRACQSTLSMRLRQPGGAHERVAAQHALLRLEQLVHQRCHGGVQQGQAAQVE